MSFCQTQVMALTPLLEQALDEQPLLLLLWVVSVGFHSPYNHPLIKASLVAQLVKNPPAMWETWVQSLGWEDPLKKGMATHSSILAWRIPRTGQSMGSQRVGHD